MLSLTRWLTRTACLAAVVLSACGGDTTPADGVYVGRAGDIMIAVVADKDVVAVYACDGTADDVSLSTWFYGQLDTGAGTVVGDGDAEVELSFTEPSFAGELRIGGDAHPFTGERVAGAAGGLLWGEAGDWIGGWIFADDGEQRGAVLKRNTGDVAAFLLPMPGVQTISLPDATAISVARMAAPRDVQ